MHRTGSPLIYPLPCARRTSDNRRRPGTCNWRRSPAEQAGIALTKEAVWLDHFERPGVRPARPGQPPRGPRPARGRLPRLPSDRRAVVRAAERLPRPRPGGGDRGQPRGRVLRGQPAMIETIRDLADADLRALASALRAGRLCPPFSAATLQRYYRPETAAAVAERLQRLAGE